MRHHLYGVLERPPLASRLPEAGVDEQSILVRRIGGLVLLSTLVEESPRPTPCCRRRHQEVLESVSVPGPLFPLRYGVSVPSREVEAWLAVRAPMIRAGLRTVRGKVEMHVNVLAPHFGMADVGRVQDVADRVTSASGIASWRGRLADTGGNAAVALAFLVPRAEVATFLARIAPVASRAADIAVVPSGPWPPFTFVPPLDAPLSHVPDAVAVSHAV